MHDVTLPQHFARITSARLGLQDVELRTANVGGTMSGIESINNCPFLLHMFPSEIWAALLRVPTVSNGVTTPPLVCHRFANDAMGGPGPEATRCRRRESCNHSTVNCHLRGATLPSIPTHCLRLLSSQRPCLSPAIPLHPSVSLQSLHPTFVPKTRWSRALPSSDNKRATTVFIWHYLQLLLDSQLRRRSLSPRRPLLSPKLPPHFAPGGRSRAHPRITTQQLQLTQ